MVLIGGLSAASFLLFKFIIVNGETIKNDPWEK